MDSYKPSRAILELGDGFYDPVRPANFPRVTLRYRNDRAAAEVGLDIVSAESWMRHFARFVPLPNTLSEPLALRYHGHQFGIYNPDLGDGRGFLFAQMIDTRGRLMDLGTKGSGKTPWSRAGDGRLTLKGGVREVLATEMLEALGVSTSRTFSLFETGEQLFRGDEPSPTRSSVLVRLSHSHVRFGTFQRYAFLGDTVRLEKLLDYAIRHYAPALAPLKGGARVTAFLEEIVKRAAALCAAWMSAGFVHGVLNTDNMTITGESFDYGPYRFLPTYDPDFVAAYFDHAGLYAFGKQPRAVAFNLSMLAEALTPIAEGEILGPALATFSQHFNAAFSARFFERIGRAPFGDERDDQLISASFAFLELGTVGFEQFFFDWYAGEPENDQARAYAHPAFESVRPLLQSAPLTRNRRHPYFNGTPCTLLIDEIEEIWRHIDEQDEWGPLYEKVARIREMGVALGGSSDTAKKTSI